MGDEAHEPPHRLLGRAGLVFAYLCFMASLGAFAAAILLLPLPVKVKIFLAIAAVVLAAMFVAMAVIAHLARGAGSPRGRTGS